MHVAVAQIDPKLAEKERNLDACLARLDEAAAQGAELLVLPECAIPGYMFESAEEALPYAEEIPGPSTEALEEASSRTGAHVVCGLLERDGDRLHNAAVLVGPDGLLGSYRKTHLPFLGVDRFVTPGDELPVWDTPLGRIGVEICYDLRFPEVTRTLALRGADIVCHPTNFPVAARVQTDLITVARAAGMSGGPSSAATARSSTRTERAWPRLARQGRPYSSPMSRSRRRATRTTWFRASTSSISSATAGPSSTAPSSRRPRASRPKEAQ
jgi:predicted amidohydrolase